MNGPIIEVRTSHKESVKLPAGEVKDVVTVPLRATCALNHVAILVDGSDPISIRARIGNDELAAWTMFGSGSIHGHFTWKGTGKSETLVIEASNRRGPDWHGTIVVQVNELRELDVIERLADLVNDDQPSSALTEVEHRHEPN